MASVLLSGGRGLIGQRLGQELVRSGRRVISLTRKINSLNFDYPCAQFEWKDLEAISAKDIEAVIHLAGESIAEKRWNAKVKSELIRSRVDTTRQLKKFCHDRGIKTFISASATGFFGERGEERLHEESAKGTGFLADLCQAWEEAALLEDPSQQRNSIRSSVLRIGIVLAKERSLRQGALGRMKPIFRDGFGAALGSGKQWMSWVHLDDVIGSMMWALSSNSAKGVYNCVAPNPVTNMEFSRALAKHFSRGLLPAVPKFALQILYGEFAEFLMQSQRVFPDRLIKEGYKFNYADLNSALLNCLPKLLPYEEELIFEQFIAKPRREVFKFFEDEKNLEAITPPWLNFHVESKSTSELGAGTLLDYRLGLYGIPLRWQTLIEDWESEKRFVDTQKKGPYQKWHHTHEFENLGQGTLMRDVVRLKVPFGGLGYYASQWKVLTDVQKIFQYRREWVDKNYG